MFLHDLPEVVGIPANLGRSLILEPVNMQRQHSTQARAGRTCLTCISSCRTLDPVHLPATSIHKVWLHLDSQKKKARETP